jgi:hypothetical protein
MFNSIFLVHPKAESVKSVPLERMQVIRDLPRVQTVKQVKCTGAGFLNSDFFVWKNHNRKKGQRALKLL